MLEVKDCFSVWYSKVFGKCLFLDVGSQAISDTATRCCNPGTLQSLCLTRSSAQLELLFPHFFSLSFFYFLKSHALAYKPECDNVFASRSAIWHHHPLAQLVQGCTGTPRYPPPTHFSYPSPTQLGWNVAAVISLIQAWRYWWEGKKNRYKAAFCNEARTSLKWKWKSCLEVAKYSVVWCMHRILGTTVTVFKWQNHSLLVESTTDPLEMCNMPLPEYKMGLAQTFGFKKDVRWIRVSFNNRMWLGLGECWLGSPGFKCSNTLLCRNYKPCTITALYTVLFSDSLSPSRTLNHHATTATTTKS